MEYNNPKDINNIAELCDSHIVVEYKINKYDRLWKQGILAGIRRFADCFLFFIHDNLNEYYVQIIKITDKTG
jgi:hypothetical protein